VHTGRRSQHRYETPVNVFRRGNEFVIALTYGVESDWLKNVLSAGGCELVTRGRCVRLTTPVVRHDESRRLVPLFVRPMLRLLSVTDFVCLTIAAPGPS
jgi:deazaflavin-dependent oxidoreductase (nitroreductase family)